MLPVFSSAFVDCIMLRFYQDDFNSDVWLKRSKADNKRILIFCFLLNKLEPMPDCIVFTTKADTGENGERKTRCTYRTKNWDRSGV